MSAVGVQLEDGALLGDREQQAAPAGPPGAGQELWSLRGLFRAYRWRILLTYALFNLENLLALAQPFVLGLAINGLLAGSYLGLGLLATQHLSHVLLGVCRRSYDTRAFSSIYADLATQVVLDQRGRQVEVSRVAARSALSRELVYFFERHLPLAVNAVYSVAGALVLLAWYAPLLVPLCLALLLPAYVLNRIYGRRVHWLNGQLNDQLEREVEVIGRSNVEEVRGHYRLLGGWRVKLSDWEAWNFGLMEVFVLGLLAAALTCGCSMPGAGPGDVFAVFRYVLLFVMGLDSLPILVEQFGRLRDVRRRIRGLGVSSPELEARACRALQ